MNSRAENSPHISSTTVASLATPAGIGGIAVIRVSGRKAVSIATKVSGRKRQFIKPRYATYTPLLSASKEEIDMGVITFFPGPNSYTGEDVVEFSCHGGGVIAAQLLDACFALGCEPAEPGEFTKRAFMNGKLDLCQAEAVADVIMSQSALRKNASYRVLSGKFSELISNLKESLLHLVSVLEAELDFTEDEIVPMAPSEKGAVIANALDKTEKVLSTYRTGKMLQDGALIVLIGQPNVGKSSILNAILSEERTIVSETPGTTRDAVEVPFLINDFPVRFVDTAGLRESAGTIESRGIDFTHKYLGKSDLVLNVVDISQPEASVKEDVGALSIDKPVIHVLNKCDLLKNGAAIAAVDHKLSVSVTSALRGDGIDDLLQDVYNEITEEKLLSNELILTNRRHKRSLDAVAESLRHALEANNTGRFPEIVATELRASLSHLDEILGVTTADDILDNIFSTFCIGK